jgi:hypothetical protein
VTFRAARVHTSFLTPHNSIAFLAVFAAALALIGTYVWLAVISILARLIIYAVTIAALPRAPQRGTVPRWLYLMGAAGMALCIWASLQIEWESWRVLALLALAGAALYAIARMGASSKADAVSAIQPPPSNRDPS